MNRMPGCVRSAAGAPVPAPDTTYLAWDALHAGARPTPAGVPAVAGPWRPAYAHPLRFHTRARAGLQVLATATHCALSPLSRQVAARIARDEATTLVSAALG